MSVTFWPEYNNFHTKNYIWKCRLQNFSHFIPASLCKKIVKFTWLSIAVYGFYVINISQVSKIYRPVASFTNMV